MEFGLSEEQLAMGETVSKLLETQCSPASIRDHANAQTIPLLANSLGHSLRELGLESMVLEQDYGGLELGMLDAVVVQEQLGRSVCPTAFTARSVVAPFLLNRVGKAKSWLQGHATGEIRFGLAVTELVGKRQGFGLRLHDNQLDGKSLFAMECSDATHVIAFDEQRRLHIADKTDEGLHVVPLPNIDVTRDVSELQFVNAKTSCLTDSAVEASRVLAELRVLIAADTLGAAQYMLDAAVAYALDRKQFGRVIGSYQAVKHMCADMAAKLEPCRAFIWHAAHALDADDEQATYLSCLAKAHTSEVAQFVARTSIEVHGGMGFTDLLGLHFWFKRIGLNRQLFGGPQLLRREAATLAPWGSG